MLPFPPEAQAAIRRLALTLLCLTPLLVYSPAALSQATTGGGTTGKPDSTTAATRAAADPDLRSVAIAPQNVPPDDKPVRLTFAPTPAFKTSNRRMLTLTAGNEAIRLPLIQASGDFDVTPTRCDLAPHDSCALSVSFSPKTRGAVEGAISLIAPNGASRVIALASGSATAPDERVVWWLAAAYLVGLLLFRWNMIALPDRRMLQAQIAIAKSRAAQLKLQLQPFHAKAHLENVIALLDDADKAAVAGRESPLEYVLWSRGHEIQSLAMLHAAEVMMVPHLAAEEVRSKLQRAESALRDAAKPSAIELADNIRSSLGPTIGAAGGGQRATVIDTKVFCDKLAGQFTPLVTRFDQPAPSAEQLKEAGLILNKHGGAAIGEEIAAALKEPAEAANNGLRSFLEQADHLLKTLAELDKNLKNTPPAMPAEQLGAAARELSDALRMQSSRADAVLSSAGAYSLARRRALLTEALGYLNGRADNADAILLSWQNKALWLTGCGVGLIIALSYQHGNGTLFVLGAVGGLLSRLSRDLYREDMPTDYSASWTTLFLSVIVGSLAGWAGVLMVQLSVGLGVLGSLFASIVWDNSYNPLAFGLALLFGFSERAFDTLFTNLQTNLFSRERTPVAAPTGTPPLVIATTPSPSAATEGKLFTHPFKATGGVPAYTWRLVAPVPDNIKIDQDTGVVSWTPTGPGPVQITVRVTDHAGATDTKQFALTASARAS